MNPRGVRELYSASSGGGRGGDVALAIERNRADGIVRHFRGKECLPSFPHLFRGLRLKVSQMLNLARDDQIFVVDRFHPVFGGEALRPFGDKVNMRLSLKSSAARTGFRMRSTQPTPPARSVAPSMMRASSCTLPSRLRKLPRPASKLSSSSMMTTDSSTASSADAPRSSTLHLRPWRCARRECGLRSWHRDRPGSTVNHQNRTSWHRALSSAFSGHFLEDGTAFTNEMFRQMEAAAELEFNRKRDSSLWEIGSDQLAELEKPLGDWTFAISKRLRFLQCLTSLNRQY